MRMKFALLSGMLLASPVFAQLQNVGSNATNIATSGATAAATNIANSVASQVSAGLLGGGASLPAPTVQIDASPCPAGCDCAEDQLARQVQQQARQQASNHFHSATSITGDLGALNCLNSIMLGLSAVNPELPSASAIMDFILNRLEKAVCSVALAEWSAVTGSALAAGEDYVGQTVGGPAGGMAANAVGQVGSGALHPPSNAAQIYSIGDPTGAASGANSASIRGTPSYNPVVSPSPAAGAASTLFGGSN